MRIAHLPSAEYRKAAKKLEIAERDKIKTAEREAKGHRRRKFNLTEEQYQQMLQNQHGHCAICPTTEDLVVDHCHDTGKVRGLLCRKCNVALGMFADSKDKLEAALNYLK